MCSSQPLKYCSKAGAQVDRSEISVWAATLAHTALIATLQLSVQNKRWTNTPAAAEPLWVNWRTVQSHSELALNYIEEQQWWAAQIKLCIPQIWPNTHRPRSPTRQGNSTSLFNGTLLSVTMETHVISLSWPNQPPTVFIQWCVKDSIFMVAKHMNNRLAFSSAHWILIFCLQYPKVLLLFGLCRGKSEKIHEKNMETPNRKVISYHWKSFGSCVCV